MLLVRVLDTHVILFRSRLNPSVPSAVFFSCRIVGLGLCARSCQLIFLARLGLGLPRTTCLALHSVS